MILKYSLKNLVLTFISGLMLSNPGYATLAAGSSNYSSGSTGPDGLDCEVYNGSFVGVGADVSKVQAFCQSLYKSLVIEGDNAGDANGVKIAIDAAGNALAVWYQNDLTGNDNIWANRYAKSNGWGNAELIETNNSGNARAPQIAMDDYGNALVVWIQSDGTRENIWANRYTTGDGWGGAELIESDNSGDASFQKIAMDSAGNALAVWQQFDGALSNIWANRYTKGKGWGSAELIESDNTGNAEHPDIAMDSAGNAFAGWAQYDGARRNVWVNRYVAGDGWGDAELIETDNTGNASAPDIAMDSAGNAFAVWRQFDGARYSLWANRYQAGSGWASAELIETDNTGDTLFQKMAVDSAGNAYVAWSQYDGSRANIWANQYTLGSGWGSAKLIETSDTGNAWISGIALNPDGNALAVWSLSNGTQSSIWFNQYKSGSGWEGSRLVATKEIASRLIHK